MTFHRFNSATYPCAKMNSRMQRFCIDYKKYISLPLALNEFEISDILENAFFAFFLRKFLFLCKKIQQMALLSGEFLFLQVVMYRVSTNRKFYVDFKNETCFSYKNALKVKLKKRF